VDVSQRISVSAWQCLKNAGYTFAIPRVHRSTGSVDPNAVANIKDAHSAGFANVDGYIFPCQKCSANATKQAHDAVANLKNNGASFGMLWIDVEGGSTYWSTNKNTNAAFLQEMANTLSSLGVRYGVYANWNSWAEIAGTWSGLSSVPIWYPHYDGLKSFSDFKPFGGWTKPSIKQYMGDKTECGVGIDMSFY